MEETKQTLERAQAAPESQREQILKGITGDKLTGDMLTTTVWGYFASLQSQGLIAASQAQMVDAPTLSYGLFHAQVKPNKLYGLVNRGVTFQGLNMDIGHLRHVRWVKDDDPKSQINKDPNLAQNGKTAAQNRWIAYNKMRGQYASAMEHAAPEAFWVDKTKCSYTDENGRIQNPTLNPCAEGISAVKAIAIAQSEGQKIYTINKANAQTALAKLPIGGEVGSEIRNAVNAGKEVTVHEKSINKHGWKGFGYIVIDSETGAGAYLIEGSGNGAILMLIGVIYMMAALSIFLALGMGAMGGLPAIGIGIAMSPAIALAMGAAIDFLVSGILLYAAGLSLAIGAHRACAMFMGGYATANTMLLIARFPTIASRVGQYLAALAFGAGFGISC